MTENKKNVHVVVLCDRVNDERSPLMSQSPMAVWPVWGQSSLPDFLKKISHSDATSVTISYSGDQLFWSQMAQVDQPEHVRFTSEDWPAGSAGAVKQALSDAKDGLVVIYTGNRLQSPSVEVLVAKHQALGANLSVVVNPDGRSAGIYVCDVAVRELISDEGYSDIKEFLIPAMIRRGQVVKALVLSENVGVFSDSRGYLTTVLSNIELIAGQTGGLVKQVHSDGSLVWASEDYDLPDTCSVLGTVVVMPGAHIGKCCTLQGPVIIGADVKVEDNAVICRSILWDGACVGSNCLVTESVIGFNARVCPGAVVSSNDVQVGNGMVTESEDEVRKTNHIALQICRYLQNSQKHAPSGSIVSVVTLTACFLWSYWINLLDLWHVWLRNDEYSSGMLVPVLAAYVLWLRRESLRRVHLEMSVLGLVGLTVAQAFRLFGLIFMYQAAENLSIVMTIGFCVLLLGGKTLYKKTLTVLFFLVLMLPWPMRLQSKIALPLQGYATDSAVFCLETFGYDVIQEGTVIHIGDTSVAVAEACNGLRMVTAFFVIAGLVALIAKRPLWEKVAILFSSLPIALVCNTIRLAVTAIAFTMITGDSWEQVFHDFGGYAMMPLALGIVVSELWIFSKLTIEPTEDIPLVIRRGPYLNEENTR